jgi:dTDP-4-dehydrorhamnose 3,5-epimerase
MKAIATNIPELLIIEPRVYSDDRGYFYESYNRQKFAELTGRSVEFVQDNHSRSVKGVLRGLHYQIQHPQAKLVRVVQGSVLDVAVDLRKNSLTFGQHVSIILSSENRRMFWIPEGFAHGFAVLSDTAEFLYKTTDYWYPEHERCLLCNDPMLAIDWQLTSDPVISGKDRQGKLLVDADLFE